MTGKLVATAEYVTFKNFREKIYKTKDKEILKMGNDFAIVK